MRQRTDALDALGNTTAATGKGFAIGSAALTALALLASYVEEIKIALIRTGEALPNVVMPSDLDRETMVFPKVDRDKCIGCGRCYISCMDGGHQAISFGEDRQPRIIGTKCVGCHLCRLVCPTNAMGMAKRMSKKQ